MNELFIAHQLMGAWDDSDAFDEASWQDKTLENAIARDAWHVWLTQ